jgi:hypothetical protein
MYILLADKQTNYDRTKADIILPLKNTGQKNETACGNQHRTIPKKPRKVLGPNETTKQLRKRFK